MLTDTRWFYWHPLAYMAHAAEISLFGADLRLHHFAGIALHAANAAWVLVLGCAFLGPRRGAEPAARPATLVGAAFLGALLWALHPLRVESVAWIAERKDLLCAFLSFAATAAWLLRATAPEGARRGPWTAAAHGLFLLALAAKPTAVALPVAWFVLDATVPGLAAGKGGLRAAALEKVPFLVLGLAAVVVGASGTKEEGRTSDALALGAEHRVLTPLWGFAAPLVRTLLPDGLSPFEPQFLPEEIRLLSPRWLGSLVLLAAGTAFVLKGRGRGGWGPVAVWFTYLALALPVSGVRQLAGLATADRFSYVATVPLYAGLGAGVLATGTILAARFGARGGAILAALLLAIAGHLAVLTARQVPVWRDPGTLWGRVLREWPGRVPMAHDHLGAWWAARAAATGDRELWERAAAEFRASLRLAPGSPSAENNLGRATEILGDPGEAERLYRKAAAEAPAFPIPRMNLARLLATRGRPGEAERWYREATATGGWIPPVLRAEVEGLLRVRGR